MRPNLRRSNRKRSILASKLTGANNQLIQKTYLLIFVGQNCLLRAKPTNS
jgi:hypothetical protein